MTLIVGILDDWYCSDDIVKKIYSNDVTFWRKLNVTIVLTLLSPLRYSEEVLLLLTEVMSVITVIVFIVSSMKLSSWKYSLYGRRYSVVTMTFIDGIDDLLLPLCAVLSQYEERNLYSGVDLFILLMENIIIQFMKLPTDSVHYWRRVFCHWTWYHWSDDVILCLIQRVYYHCVTTDEGWYRLSSTRWWWKSDEHCSPCRSDIYSFCVLILFMEEYVLQLLLFQWWLIHRADRGQRCCRSLLLVSRRCWWPENEGRWPCDTVDLLTWRRNCQWLDDTDDDITTGRRVAEKAEKYCDKSILTWRPSVTIGVTGDVLFISEYSDGWCCYCSVVVTWYWKRERWLLVEWSLFINATFVLSVVWYCSMWRWCLVKEEEDYDHYHSFWALLLWYSDLVLSLLIPIPVILGVLYSCWKGITVDLLFCCYD